MEKLRNSRGLSEKQFAEKLQVTRLYKSGGSVDFAVILRASIAFNVPVESLTGEPLPLYKVPTGEGVTREEPEVFLDPKRARLVELVKKLAADKNTKETVIDALLHNAEVFSEVPKEKDEKDKKE